MNIFNSIDFGEILFLLLFTVSVAFKCFYFQYDSRLNGNLEFTEINKNMIISSIAVIFAIIAIISLIFFKGRKTALFVVNILITILVLADTIYFRYYYSAMTVSLIYQVGLVGSIGDSIKDLLNKSDLLLLADLPVMLIILICLSKYQRKVQKVTKFSFRIIISVTLAAFSIFTIKTVYGKTDNDIYNYDTNHVIKQMGLLYYHYYDAREFVKDNYLIDRNLTSDDKAELEQFFENKKKTGENFKGVAEGKNLIIVQVEALQHFVINRKTEAGAEITPNLNKLLKESTYFDNIYFQIGSGNTSDAEFLSNNSLYPLRDGSIYFRYPGNTFFSLPKALKAKGYNTYAFHANNSSFWNRSAMYQAVGFDYFISNRDYVLDEYIGWGLGDTSFFRQSLDFIDKTKPFYSFLITLSSHHPFNFEYFQTYEFDVGKYEGTLLGDYLKAINYADSALGRFIEMLKEQGLYDNTLLVIYGDHQAIIKSHSEELFDFIGEEYNEINWIKEQKVPLIIHGPGIENDKVISTIGGEIDIYPTIANLMNLEAPFVLGKDLLNTAPEEGYAVLRDGTVITDNFIYICSMDKAFELSTGREMSQEEYKSELETYHYELRISDIINQKDALKYINKNYKQN
ncbi:MAG TPA: LTA synthase family protein [Clostridiaceae bacterium]|nr:LTA synthase family protein [Clostridiaceae bacterium]